MRYTIYDIRYTIYDIFGRISDFGDIFGRISDFGDIFYYTKYIFTILFFIAKNILEIYLLM